MYQGRPRPLGDAIFGDATFYREIPNAVRYGHGLDLAYTESTAADYSVCVTGAVAYERFKCADKWSSLPVLYIVNVVRKQVDAPAFTLSIVAQQAAYPGPMLFRGSGTEKGSSQFIATRVKRFQHQQVKANKVLSSQEYAAAWNDGRVRLPEGAPWLPQFLAEHQRFTGVKDAHDDQVDAGGNLFTVLTRGRVHSSADAGRRKRMPKRRI